MMERQLIFHPASNVMFIVQVEAELVWGGGSRDDFIKQSIIIGKKYRMSIIHHILIESWEKFFGEPPVQGTVWLQPRK